MLLITRTQTITQTCQEAVDRKELGILPGLFPRVKDHRVVGRELDT